MELADAHVVDRALFAARHAACCNFSDDCSGTRCSLLIVGAAARRTHSGLGAGAARDPNGLPPTVPHVGGQLRSARELARLSRSAGDPEPGTEANRPFSLTRQPAEKRACSSKASGARPPAPARRPCSRRTCRCRWTLLESLEWQALRGKERRTGSGSVFCGAAATRRWPEKLAARCARARRRSAAVVSGGR